MSRSVSLWPILHLASGFRNIIAQRFEKSELFSPNNWCRDVTFEMSGNRELGSQRNKSLICMHLRPVTLHPRCELPISKKLDVCETSLEK